jgi:hypothetical protein
MEEITRLCFRFILSALAVYRFAHLMTLETGPGGVFLKLRSLVAYKFGPDSLWAEASTCVLCQSVWYSFLAVILVMPWSGLVDFVLYWFSMSGLVMVMHIKAYR